MQKCKIQFNSYNNANRGIHQFPILGVVSFANPERELNETERGWSVNEMTERTLVREGM
jgi:hypothetical protein